MKKQLHVMHVLEATCGGTIRHLQLIAKYLPCENLRLSFIISPVRNPQAAVSLQPYCCESENIHEIKMYRAISPVADFIAYRSLKKLLSLEKPDIVHTHCSKAGFLGRAAALQGKCKSIHTPHVFAIEWAKGSVAANIYKLAERIASRWTDKLIVFHEQQSYLAEHALGFPEAKLFCLPNAIDTSLFIPAQTETKTRARKTLNLPKNAKIVGMAARLEPQKSVGTFISAARQVLREFPRAIFTISGTGSEEKQLKREVLNSALNNSFHFLGQIENMPLFYQSLDIFVLSSRWEGMPYVILEAQSCGLPIVASATAGNRALLKPGITGTLTSINNAEEIASSICTYLGDPRLRERVGKKGRENVCLNHNIDAWTDKLKSLYFEIA